MRRISIWRAASLLAGLVAAAMSSSAGANPLEDKIIAAFEAGELPGLHSTKIDLGGETLAEVYVAGEDEAWGRPLGLRQHGPDTLHDLRSVTKSIVGLLYGIAWVEGKVPAVEQPLLAQFPDYADLADGSGREEILIEHALKMRMGLEWNENLP
ncbi:MAG: serine hydrolase, partial [Pseudomonadota bacterium]